MVKLISYPFRLSVNGSVATIEEGEDYYGDELAMLVRTVPGERELVPTYGIQDPTFGAFNRFELLQKISTFGPPIDIVNTSSYFVSDGRVKVNISYQETPIEDDEFEDEENEYDDEYDEDPDDPDGFSDPDYNFNDDQDVLDGV
jgi:hypothetical protein